MASAPATTSAAATAPSATTTAAAEALAPKSLTATSAAAKALTSEALAATSSAAESLASESLAAETLTTETLTTETLPSESLAAESLASKSLAPHILVGKPGIKSIPLLLATLSRGVAVVLVGDVGVAGRRGVHTLDKCRQRLLDNGRIRLRHREDLDRGLRFENRVIKSLNGVSDFLKDHVVGNDPQRVCSIIGRNAELNLWLPLVLLLVVATPPSTAERIECERIPAKAAKTTQASESSATHAVLRLHVVLNGETHFFAKQFEHMLGDFGHPRVLELESLRPFVGQ